MIIDHIINPKLVPYIDDLHTDYSGKIIKSPCTYTLVAEHSEYVQKNDVIYYEIGFEAKHLSTPLIRLLSNEQIHSIKDKKVLLMVDLSLETRSDQIAEVYNNLVIKEQLPPSQIVIISHTLDYVERINDYAKLNNTQPIRYEYFPYWVRLQQITYKNDCTRYNIPVEHNNSGLYRETNKKFLFLNNNWKEHRVALLCLLNDYDLLKDSFTSFTSKPQREGLYDNLVKNKQPIPDWLLAEQNNTIEQNWSVWLEYATQMFPKLINSIVRGSSSIILPFTLDLKEFPLSIAYTSQTSLIKFYKNTYFSVVTAARYHGYNENHVDEKPFKPITYKHPFVYCGQPYSLRHLRQMGYRTFDGIIDESYDTELDPNKRMLMVADEIKRLSNLNEIELVKFKQECIPIVEYNFNRFINEKSFIQKVL